MNSITEHKIFTPFTIGRVSLRHRVVMAPLTRLRSEQPGDVPGPLMAQYYEERTSPGGLIITESAEITPESMLSKRGLKAVRLCAMGASGSGSPPSQDF
jgi:2,4-dienoyl-CoA reductase-like NADH-dependent reductase (Old Yellow Enzyme family)